MLGLAREKIPAYATARNVEPTPEQVFEEAKERKAQGYHAFKIQFWDGLDRDIPRFRAAREAVGDDFPLMQDAAGMYTYSQAIAAGKVLGDLNYTWFEEPIPDRNLFQLKRPDRPARGPDPRRRDVTGPRARRGDADGRVRHRPRRRAT